MIAQEISRIRIYEQQPLRAVAGNTIRPGGLTLTEHALKFCDLPVGARVLDVGCGPGASVEYLMQQNRFVAVGIDPSPLLLSDAHCRNESLSLAQSPGEVLPFASSSFDAIMTECSLSVMDHPDQAMEEFHRVLSKGGYLVITDVYARNRNGVADLRCLNIDSCLRGAMLQDEVMTLVQAHGFKVTLWEDHTQALRVFTAQLIWTYGSVGNFWCRTMSARHDTPVVQSVIAQSKPGYFLLIARKL